MIRFATYILILCYMDELRLQLSASQSSEEILNYKSQITNMEVACKQDSIISNFYFYFLFFIYFYFILFYFIF
jgi:hypothetical protein